jgi:hypothetical protein
MINNINSLNKNFNYYLYYLENNKPQKLLFTLNPSFIFERLKTQLIQENNNLSIMELCSNGDVKIKKISLQSILSIKKQNVIKEIF